MLGGEKQMKVEERSIKARDARTIKETRTIKKSKTTKSPGKEARAPVKQSRAAELRTSLDTVTTSTWWRLATGTDPSLTVRRGASSSSR